MGCDSLIEGKRCCIAGTGNDSQCKRPERRSVLGDAGRGDHHVDKRLDQADRLHAADKDTGGDDDTHDLTVGRTHTVKKCLAHIGRVLAGHDDRDDRTDDHRMGNPQFFQHWHQPSRAKHQQNDRDDRHDRVQEVGLKFLGR